MILVVAAFLLIFYYIIKFFCEIFCVLINAKSHYGTIIATIIFDIIIFIIWIGAGEYGVLLGGVCVAILDLIILISRHQTLEEQRKNIIEQNKYTEEYGLIEDNK